MNKVRQLIHCCEDCLFLEIAKKKPACTLKDEHFTKQPKEEINDCPNWQN